jgi:hypothetical protein
MTEANKYKLLVHLHPVEGEREQAEENARQFRLVNDDNLTLEQEERERSTSLDMEQRHTCTTMMVRVLTAASPRSHICNLRCSWV